jgi:hypothetical protein
MLIFDMHKLAKIGSALSAPSQRSSSLLSSWKKVDHPNAFQTSHNVATSSRKSGIVADPSGSSCIKEDICFRRASSGKGMIVR